ncbi:hypothetical protein [Actinomadura sp. 3N508]|uniref:hypothetical protein n=1 Tax=Actinomadura sp. 3N508 TaxID=3375153 RepID=UPI0037A28284
MPVAIRASAERLVVAATMGPTVHEVHAWRFSVVPGLIELHVDPVRFRPPRDPLGRELHLAGGAALVNLRLAAVQLGRAAVVRLLPDAGRPSVLAAVRLAGRHRITREERLLYAASLRAFTVARPAVGERPRVAVVNELAGAARLEGVRFRPLPTAHGAASQRGVLATYGDSPAQWLRAGQALQRVLLAGRVRGVSASFSFQAGDVAGVEDVTRPGEVPQVIVELTRRCTRAYSSRR